MELCCRELRERFCPRGRWSQHELAGLGALGHCSQTLGLGGAVWRWGLDLVIPVGPLQFSARYLAGIPCKVFSGPVLNQEYFRPRALYLTGNLESTTAGIQHQGKLN